MATTKLVVLLLVAHVCYATRELALRVTRRAIIAGSIGPVLAHSAAHAKNEDIVRFELEKARRKYGTLPSTYRPNLSNDDALAFELLSRQVAISASSTVQIIDVMEGDGPMPADGQRVYLHYKVWVGGFDRGQPITASYFKQNPVYWVLGEEPPAELVEGIVSSLNGLREGGWRRLVIPPALGYGHAGLPGSQTLSRLSVPPDSTLFVDLRMMDAGSGRCDTLIRQAKLKSVTCGAASRF